VHGVMILQLRITIIKRRKKLGIFQVSSIKNDKKHRIQRYLSTQLDIILILENTAKKMKTGLLRHPSLLQLHS
jgi:hypothetical protein